MLHMLRTAAIAATLSLASISAFAGSGDVVLTIDGGVAGGKAIELTVADLEALGSATIRTGTPWDDQVVTFEGVPMRALMDKVGAAGEDLAIVALNNYRTEVPLADFAKYDVILALKKDGAYMPVSDKGPLFVVYPFDAHPELKTELYYGRSAWQVRSMTVE